MEIVQRQPYLTCPRWWNPQTRARVIVFDESIESARAAMQLYLNTRVPKLLVRTNCSVSSPIDNKLLSEFLCVGTGKSVFDSRPQVSNEYVFVCLARQCQTVPTLEQFARGRCNPEQLLFRDYQHLRF